MREKRTGSALETGDPQEFGLEGGVAAERQAGHRGWQSGSRGVGAVGKEQ